MTYNTSESPTTGTAQADLLPLRAVHHVEIYCGNARQAAYFYRRALGFSLVAYSGPETGNRETASYVVQQDKIRLVLTTPLVKDHFINEFLERHGDGVRDIALETIDAAFCYWATTERGAQSVCEPRAAEDANGMAVLATVQAYGDTVHTFVQKGDYKGAFLPGYQAVESDLLADQVGLVHIDHVVGNMGWDQMEQTVRFYNDVFGLERFVSFDDKDISTEYTALRSTVVANSNRWIKFPINEPAEGKRSSQIEEYVRFNNGPGVQHVAMSTKDIIETVTRMRKNGVEFLETPDAYYEDLLDRVGPINEEIETLRSLRILVDRDDKGYMLQIFTRPVQDRPTLFYEIIQREGAESFGKGNFKSLFESIEREQARRGNL